MNCSKISIPAKAVVCFVPRISKGERGENRKDKCPASSFSQRIVVAYTPIKPPAKTRCPMSVTIQTQRDSDLSYHLRIRICFVYFSILFILIRIQINIDTYVSKHRIHAPRNRKCVPGGLCANNSDRVAALPFGF